MIKNFPQIANKIKGSIAYIDTLNLWLIEPLSEAEYKDFKDLGGDQVREIEKENFVGEYTQRLILEQPSHELLSWLDNRLSTFYKRRHIFTRLDIALDLICDNYEDALDLLRFVDLHLTQPWRRDSKRFHFKDTVYSKKIVKGKKTPRNNIAVYQRKSKLTDAYCCHIEWRIISSNAISSNNITDINDLVNFNYYEFWKKKLRLEYIDVYKLGKIALKRTRRKKPLFMKHNGKNYYDKFLMTGGLLSRCCKSEYGTSAQDLLDYFHNTAFDVKKSLVRLDNSILLPSTSPGVVARTH